MPRTIPTFFYGSFINRDVLKAGGFAPDALEVCVLHGHDIDISGAATLTPAENASVYGVLAHPTVADLKRLYAQDWLAGTYAPAPVVVAARDGQRKLALCYIAEQSVPRPALDYLDWILVPAAALGFPDWYVSRLRQWDERANTF